MEDIYLIEQQLKNVKNLETAKMYYNYALETHRKNSEYPEGFW